MENISLQNHSGFTGFSLHGLELPRTGKHTIADGYAGADRHAQAHFCCHLYSHPHPHSHSYTYAHSYSHSYTYTHPYAHSYTYTHPYFHPNSYAQPYSHPYSHPYPHLDASARRAA